MLRAAVGLKGLGFEVYKLGRGRGHGTTKDRKSRFALKDASRAAGA